MEGLDGGFESNAQETQGLRIEPLPLQIMSDRHGENSTALLGKIGSNGTLVGLATDQKNVTTK
jgi:hypothetical protein